MELAEGRTITKGKDRYFFHLTEIDGKYYARITMNDVSIASGIFSTHSGARSYLDRMVEGYCGDV